MTMTASIRKFALTAHVTSSLGWLGTVASFQALAIAAVASREPETVRSFYLAMELIGWYVIVPFCIAALVTGLAVSLGTPWGLFRYYWVLLKFLITTIAALILFGFTQTLSALGDLAADPTLSLHGLRDLKQSPVLHSCGGLLAILAATVLAIYKPWGMTPYGRRQRGTGGVREPESPASSPWRIYLLLGGVSLILLLLILHLLFGGPRGH